VYLGLRQRALDAIVTGPITPRPEHPRIAGVVIDVPSSGGFATVVALADDTSSLYTSVGGGMIGGGAHESVATANRHLLTTIDEQLLAFSIGGDDAFPGSGLVRYHVLGATSRSTADVPEASFWGKADHPLMPVIVATQELIAAMRVAAERASDR
jgi:hypothetical protein